MKTQVILRKLGKNTNHLKRDVLSPMSRPSRLANEAHVSVTLHVTVRSHCHSAEIYNTLVAV